MSTAIIVAIVAFVSAILGASISAVTNYILAVRRERADAAKRVLSAAARARIGRATKKRWAKFRAHARKMAR